MKYSPRKAILVKCKECACGSLQEVQKCTVRDCALWPYRWGKPDFKNAVYPPKFWPEARKSTLTTEQRKAAADRLMSYRTKK